ncbi:phosphopantetheine-binding protein [Pseudomonadota bacterium]
MTKDQIFRALKKNTLNVLLDLDERQIKLDDSLKELGANSIDRASIIVDTLSDLNIKMSLVEAAKATNIAELVDVLYRFGPQ